MLFRSGVYAQKDSIPEKLTWFADAKLGIFIHWGIYAVEGTSESWSFHNRTTSYPFYMSQLKYSFRSVKYEFSIISEENLFDLLIPSNLI